MKNPKMSLSTVKIYDTSYLTVMSKKKRQIVNTQMHDTSIQK